MWNDVSIQGGTISYGPCWCCKCWCYKCWCCKCCCCNWCCNCCCCCRLVISCTPSRQLAPGLATLSPPAHAKQKITFRIVHTLKCAVAVVTNLFVWLRHLSKKLLAYLWPKPERQKHTKMFVSDALFALMTDNNKTGTRNVSSTNSSFLGEGRGDYTL